MNAPYESTAALRTFGLFETFEAAKRPLTLSELAALMQIPVSSCFGLVTAARSRGYLYPLRHRGPIYPTKRMLELTQVIAAHDPVVQRVEEALVRLRDATEESAVFAKRTGHQVLYLDLAPSRNRIRYTIQIGDVREINSNSLGKALMAMMSREERLEILRSVTYTQYTPLTLTTPEALNADIERGCERGWHENFGESNPELGAIARGVKIHGEPYAICVAGPLTRMTPRREVHVAALLKTCAELSDPDASPDE